MKRIFFFIFSFILTLSTFAQQSLLDSLLTLLKTDKEDTNKVIHLNKVGEEYRMIGSYDITMKYCNSALQLAQQLNFKSGIANSCNTIGTAYGQQGNYPRVLDFLLKSLKINEELNNKSGIAKQLGNLGIVYRKQGDYPKALDYYLRAMKLNEVLGRKNGIAANLGNIGIVYYNQGDYPKALDYYFKALKMYEEIGDINGIAINFVNIGSVYSDEADKITEKNNSSKKNSLKQKALDYYLNALKINEQLGDKNAMAFNLGNIGSIFIDIKKYAESEKYLFNALKIDKEIGSMNHEMDVENYFSILYSQTNRYQLALEHYKKAMTLKDSLFSVDKNNEINRKEMTYEFNKKEAIEKAEQEKKDVIVEAESKKEKIIIWSLIFGSLLVLIFSVFVSRSLRVTRKQKNVIEIKSKETEQQKQIIEEKNKDITDSLTYAKRIQQAKLPKKEEVYSAFPQSFILFKPKDIVSGDFYFFHKKDQTIFIAAADCTGHGVPGAFMSMIGSDKLEDAVSQSTDTSEILSLLNKGIKSSLKQSDNNESTRDGMDIALCSINLEDYSVKYSGANRPLWIIRKGQIVLEEIKPTKKAIGGLTENNQHFDSHEIKLQKGDTFYLSTDGFADTFSGMNGKKLMTKRFKEILMGIQNKTMKEQEKHLDDFIESWKAGSEQVDDILVIGVRL